MRACVMRDHRLVIDDVADPRPELGQVLVRTLACGICGSDLHFLRHAETDGGHDRRTDAVHG
jgi:threonine dehydrogenase-like Zn-dependent dehydrogenase